MNIQRYIQNKYFICNIKEHKKTNNVDKAMLQINSLD